MERINAEFTNPLQTANMVKEYIKKCSSSVIELDLSALNIIDAAKILVLSSAYHYKKFPDGKLKCHTQSKDIENLLTPFAIPNLEIL